MTRSTATRTLSPQPLRESKRGSGATKRTKSMASDKDNAPMSDAETAERPVREQLRNASIEGKPESITNDSADTEMVSTRSMAAAAQREEEREVASTKKPMQKKRSFEEVEIDQVEKPSRQHTRKRSRDSTAEENELTNGKRRISGEEFRDQNAAAETNGEARHKDGDRAATPDLSVEREDEPAPLASPKTKRTRLHSAKDEANGTLEVQQPAEITISRALDDVSTPTLIEETTPEQSTTKVSVKTTTSADEVKADLPALTEAPALEPAISTTTKAPPTSGFANTSTVSPFGAVASPKPPPPEPAQTSASAFAASGFGALAGSTSSGFGAIGKTAGGFGSGGSFASGGKSPFSAATSKDEGTSESTSAGTFGGALGQKSGFGTGGILGSGFGTASSGFGRLGQASGFGSATGFASLGGAPGLSSFASGKSTLKSNFKPPKPFGAPADDDEDAENEADDGEDEKASGIKSPLSPSEDKQDERFYEQSLETGEEDEVTEYSCRAKLYNFTATADAPEGSKKEWRERGLGVLRLNVRKEDAQTRARFLMRAEGSHRVVLNTPVKKEIKFGAPNGGPPQGSYMYFMGAIEGTKGLEMLQLKMKAQFATELYEKIVELQGEM